MAAPKIDALQLQNRDLALLRGLFECRVMTTDHAKALYFDNKYEAAVKRLQKLKAADLITERPRSAFDPSVLFLTRKGLMLLQEKGVLSKYPSFDLPALDRRARVSDLTIRHELAVMDVKAAFHAAIKTAPSLTIDGFSTWPLLNEFLAYRPGNDGVEKLVKPDGFIRIGVYQNQNRRFVVNGESLGQLASHHHRLIQIQNNRNGLEKWTCKPIEQEENHEKGLR
jgi:hypothetical protein